MSNVIPGGYELAKMEACNLPEKVATGFSKITGAMLGATYLPVMYVGSQVVHGVNHMLLCKQTLSAKGAPEHLVAMTLNQDGDEWSVVSIERIV